MVQGRLKSRTFKRMDRKMPSGGSKRIYLLRKSKRAKCARCSDILKGVANVRPNKMQNLPKTAKRPERPYGGVLCSICMRKEIILQYKDK